MGRFVQRTYHFLERIKNESKNFPKNLRCFGFRTAKAIFIDGLFPPGKSEKYIAEIERFIDEAMGDFVRSYKINDNWKNESEKYPKTKKVPVWVCWWQGEESMPELVKMCFQRLKDTLPDDITELHLITFDNYKDYVTFPDHIEQKFKEKKITMTTLSDILRFCLLSEYGGFWMDATVFFTGEFPKEFLEKPFYSQKMYDPVACQREACKGRWCGFFMTGYAHNPIFEFGRDAFFEWWRKYDDIVDYVLIDYLILLGYKNFQQIKELIDDVPDNNQDIFEMYTVLDKPYTKKLYERLTKRNIIHKLTYKINLKKETADGQETLYAHLLREVYGSK